MLQHKLQDIDQQLIDLIGKRILLLTKLEHICLDEQVSNYTLSIAQAGVPESIWKNFVTNCAAAVCTLSLPAEKVQPQRITIIGGRGMMGRFFTQRLSAAGHKVTILEQGDWGQAESLLAGADLVLVCVPIEFTVDVIRQVTQYLAPTTALADIASIKAPIVPAMLEHHNGPVMGLHPMFGPGVKSFLSQNVVVCPGREDKAFQWLLNLIENEGGRLIVCEPEEHDQMMVVIQAIRNFVTFGFGVFLAEQDIDVRRCLDLSSPIFRLEFGLVSRLLTQSAPLIVDIMLATQERREAICRLVKTCDRLAQLVSNKDREALIHEFKVAYCSLGGEINPTKEESTYVIDALSTFLAAREVEQGHSSTARKQSKTFHNLQLKSEKQTSSSLNPRQNSATKNQ
ncbi:MAG: bifunctional chorismate mutase/prephenate dehydrogenase [Scytonema sp. PMC 1069.18]|nr:bifunctional chorismate mutase/prephenate dehydrogenase [Scytonema sp. PMC 1069.18]MEC4883335.1 bifunctional chorismate mutase/prephenate dehydrogenase [Scytonema sp. PMC 1070.18]